MIHCFKEKESNNILFTARKNIININCTIKESDNISESYTKTFFNWNDATQYVKECFVDEMRKLDISCEDLFDFFSSFYDEEDIEENEDKDYIEVVGEDDRIDIYKKIKNIG